MSGTQPTMADAHPPGAQVFKLPSYCMPLPVDPPRFDPGSEPTSEEESIDDKPLKMPKTPIKKPKPPPSERQYPVKLDKDGVWRYRPEEGDFKPQKREDKLTCTFKTKKAKGKPLGKSKSKVKRSLDKAMDEV